MPTLLLAWSVPATPWELIAFGRILPTYQGDWRKLYAGEGMNSSIAVTEMPSGARCFHVSGKVEASSDGRDMRVQRMLGHLPALFHRQPRSVLIVGFGAGVTAGSFVVHPEVEQITICELEPLIPKVVATYFTWENHDVVNDRRTQIVYDDARHYVLTTADQFDVITSDPIHPWVKGSATLYTKEYFELCKRRLKPGGLIAHWVPLYSGDLETAKSAIATFFEVFPNGTVWNNDQDGMGYDVVLLGQAEALTIDADELQRRLGRTDYANVLRSLKDVELDSVVGLLLRYGGRASDLRPWTEDAEINLDRNLRLQYIAGLGLNYDERRRIYDEMMSYRRYPENLLAGDGERARSWRVALREITKQQR